MAPAAPASTRIGNHADGVIFAIPGGIGYFACRQQAAISVGIAAGDGLEPPEAWTE